MFAKAFREAWRKEDQGSATRLREMVEVLRARDIVHGITPEKLRLILEDLGPTFVKLEAPRFRADEGRVGSMARGGVRPLAAAHRGPEAQERARNRRAG